MEAERNHSPLVHHRAPLSDQTFMAAFESASLTLPMWDHLSHVRAGRLLIAELSLEEAVREMRERIRALNLRNRVPESETSGYHQTVTEGFMRLIAAAFVSRPGVTSVDFCIRHPALMRARTLLRYYSRERLWTPDARAEFVEPDLLPLPGMMRLAS